MDAQQGSTTSSSGNAGNAPAGQPSAGKVNDRIAGGHPVVKKALGVSTPAAPTSQEAGKETASSTQPKTGQPSVDGGNTQPVEQAFNNKLMLKVQGREIELDLNDPNDRREAQRRLQMDLAAEQRMQQASQKEKQINALLDLAEKDPWAAAEHMAKMKNPNARLDKTEFAKHIIAEQIKQEMMDPKERALHEERLQRQQVEKQLQDRMQAEQAQYEKALSAQKAQHWETEIIQGLEKAKAPKNPLMVRMMAQNLLDAKNNGYDVSPEEAAHYTKRQYTEGVRELVKEADAAELERILGKEQVDKLIAYQVEKMRAPLNQAFAQKPSAKPDVGPQNRERKWRDWTEVRETWDRRAKT